MTPERWKEVKAIFHAALEREPGSRRDFLHGACAGNKLLLGEVESLLASYEQSGEFIDGPAFQLAAHLLSEKSPPVFSAGQIGSYRILSTLGRGGMGEVYLAEDSRLGRRVALKFLPKTHVDDPDRLRRFEQEARAASALNQPNILTIHEIGEVDGHRYIVTEYIEGQTLRHAMQAQPLTVGEALTVAEQVAAALAAAHAAGIVHRDIKPENIMLRQDGIVKVLDFGLAKLTQPIDLGPDDPTQQKINTGSGLVMGTVAYMSPEQARGLPVDARTDIWGLGVILYEVISGERPFKGSTSSDVLVSVLEREPQPLDIAALGIPETLEFIVAKALTKDCEGRYQSAREFLTDIRRLKQRMNFADELERRGAKETTSTENQRTKGSGQQAAQTQSIAGVQSEQLSGDVTTGARAKWLLAFAVLVFGLAVLAFAYMVWPTRKPGEAISGVPEVLRMSQITTRTGFEIPRLSPDANLIAYSSRVSEGALEVFVKPLTPGAREIQITSDGGFNTDPAWSSDGKWIAYHSGNKGGIWVIPATGGTAKQLTNFGADPSWSADGSLIAFQSERSFMPPTTIWAVSSQGGEPIQLTKPGTPVGGHSLPAWSPDGSRIVFVSYTGYMPGQLWSVTPKGEDLKQVVKDNSIWFKGAAFSPDGKFVYSGAVTESNNFVIYKIPVSPKGEALGDPILVKDTGLSYLDIYPTISTDGRKLLYSVVTPNGEMMSVPISPSTSEAVGPPKPLMQSSGYRKSLAAFSNDGQTIAYLQWFAGQGQKVWLMDVNGENARQLSSGPDVHWGNSWLPDNDTIVFLSQHKGAQVLKSISVRAGREKVLTKLSEPIGWTRVSPDGQQIAFNSANGGAMNTWIMSINGGDPRQLTFDREGIAWPSWSPDGKLLAMQIQRQGLSYLGIMPSSGGEVTQVTFDKGQVQPHSWSPDGDKIVFAGSRNGIWNLYWYSLTTKQQKQLTFYLEPGHYVRYPSWAPKGDQILFEYAQGIGVTWLMELK